jgi:transposase
MITEAYTSRTPQQMVWASIWINSNGRTKRSPLIIIERDIEAPRNGHSANSYCDALREGLLPNYQPGEAFMMDNARVHTARKTADFMMDHGIWVIEWPPYSPDLNPIEHLWWALKRLLHKHYPHLSNRGQGQDEWNKFCEALKDCWNRIPTRQIRNLILSMPRRIQAVQAAHGYQTKY